MTRTGAAGRPPVAEERTENLLDWIQLHHKRLLLATLVLVATALALWLFMRSREIRETNAAATLLSAEGALAQGNVQLARSDLERLTVRYEGTAAANQAAMLLAQLYYEEGEYQRGVETVQKALESRQARPVAASLHALAAGGYEELGDFTQAAREYEAAAAATRLDNLRAGYRASAARAYTSAGNAAAAQRIWGELAEDPTSPVAAEARVRLGELTTQPAS